MQKILNSKGFVIALTGLGSKGNETSYYGELTKQAVKKFQKEKGLTQDGIVNEKTRVELNK